MMKLTKFILYVGSESFILFLIGKIMQREKQQEKTKNGVQILCDLQQIPLQMRMEFITVSPIFFLQELMYMLIWEVAPHS